MAICALGVLWGTVLVHAQTMPQDNWRYDNLTFSGPDAVVYKRSIAIGSGGVFVGQGNPATTIVQFQENGVYVRTFGTFGAIVGMACDSTGSVYVLDRTDCKIKVFSKDGDALREWGEPGSEDGQFSVASWDGTTFVAVDDNDQVYVCDPGNSRVQVFDAQGNFLRKWGSVGTLPGQFASGQPLAIATAKNGWVYVGSTSDNPPRLQIFDAQGNFVKGRSEWYQSVNDFAISADGLWCNRTYNYWRGYYLTIHDAVLAQVSDPNIGYSDQGIAFNVRGDLYRVAGNNIDVFEREYSSVQNSLLPPAIPQPLVIKAEQRAGTSKMDVDYMVTDADSPTVDVAALAFVNGGNTLNEAVPMSTFLEGTATNIGTNQPIDTPRRITWDMAADWSVDFAQLQVEVLAKDSRNLLGVHWIRVPADGGTPAIEISRKPVSDAEILSLWYWFIATHDPVVTLANGTVRGTTGVYNGVDLASGTATKAPGRRFAYEQMGVRAITSGEIARALAGSYGFTSVDANSVVRETYAPEFSIVGWGYDGNGETSSLWLTGNGDYTAIAAGSNHGLALSSNGTVVAWGYNGDGRCNWPPGLTNVTAIAAGEIHSLALKSDGTVVAVGRNDYGQCNVPAGLTNVTAIAARYYYSLALTAEGTVVAWGYNGHGQCNVPAGLTNATAIAAGWYHGLALSADGTVIGWGPNWYGELNPPADLTNATAIAAGGNHSLALTSDRMVVAWGYNDNGQCNVPAGLTNVTAIAAGDSQSLALKSDGTVVAWGNNNYGQCNVPTGLTNVTAIAAGASWSVALMKLQN
jgi:hypothetical protein